MTKRGLPRLPYFGEPPVSVETTNAAMLYTMAQWMPNAYLAGKLPCPPPVVPALLNASINDALISFEEIVRLSDTLLFDSVREAAAQVVCRTFMATLLNAHSDPLIGRWVQQMSETRLAHDAG